LPAFPIAWRRKRVAANQTRAAAARMLSACSA
jgi:hypothetical protein